MTSTRSAALALLLAAAAVAGCDRAPKGDERDRAAGRILPASVSDAMLETDRSQVEAPVAEPLPDEGDAGGEDDKAEPRRRSAGAVAATPAPDDSPTPAATPLPQPTPETAL